MKSQITEADIRALTAALPSASAKADRLYAAAQTLKTDKAWLVSTKAQIDVAVMLGVIRGWTKA